MVFIPAGTHFHRHRLRHCTRNGGYHFIHLIGIQQPLGAGIGLDDFIHRAAHIDIDNISGGILINELCGCNQGLLGPAENLNADRMLPRVDKQHRQGFLVPIHNTPVTDHFTDDQAGAELFTGHPKGGVRDPRHGGDDDLVGDGDRTDFPFHKIYYSFMPSLVIIAIFNRGCKTG